MFIPTHKSRQLGTTVALRVRQRRTLQGASRSCPIFITCRDRVSVLRLLVRWLEQAGYERLILIDNDSTYPELLDFYSSTPYPKVFLHANVGHLAPWKAGVIDDFAAGQPYIVTDCDVVPDERCPSDVAEMLGHLLLRYPGYKKAGLGLRLDDLPPEYPHSELVRQWESQFWQRKIRRNVFHANIDTTFALYRAGSSFAVSPSIRTGAPYLARHIPWYTDQDILDDEETFYRDRADCRITTWNSETASHRVLDPLAQIRPLTWLERQRWRAHKVVRLRRRAIPPW